MKFCLRAETPIHVGTGEDLAWLDWFLVGREMHVLDWGRIMEAALLVHEDAAARLASFCDRSVRELKTAQSALSKAPGRERSEILRKAREQTSPIQFFEKDLGSSTLARAVRAGDYDRYRCEYLGGRLDRRLEVRAQAKDCKGQPIVPASTLRGQIRTALAHTVLGRGDPEAAGRILKGSGGTAGWERELKEATPGRARFLFGDEIENALFRASTSRSKGGRRSHGGDPRCDLMRFLIVSEPVEVRATLVALRTSPFGMSQGRGGEPARMLPLQPTVLEAIEEGSEFIYELRVDSRTLLGAARAEGGGGAQNPMVRDDFWQLFEQMFGVARDEVRKLDEEALEQRMLAAVEVSLAGRAAALHARESAWLERMNAPKQAPARALMTRLENPEGGRLPLRIGYGTGLHGKTVLAAIESDPLLGAPLGRALARAGLGLRPRERRERAERERETILHARQKGGGPSGAAGMLREELVQEKVDPGILPVTRRLTMYGGGPDQFLGHATLLRGGLSETPIKPTRLTERDDHDEHRERRDRPGGPKGPRPRGPGGKTRRPSETNRMPSKPKRPPLPDRPATSNEIEDLLKRFGPRH